MQYLITVFLRPRLRTAIQRNANGVPGRVWIKMGKQYFEPADIRYWDRKRNALTLVRDFSYERRGDLYWFYGPGESCFVLTKDKVRRITIKGWPE